MPNIWVGGDWHLWNVNLRDERHPFRSKQNIEEFKQYLASKPIQPDDVFLVLGDLCDPEVTDVQNLRDVIAAIPPCIKVLVKGNHDTAEDSLYLNAGFDLVTDIVLIHHMVFSHIPVYVSHEQLNVHAHLHSVKISVFDERYVNVKNVDPCILLDDLLDRAMRQNKSEYEGVDNDRYIQNFFRNIEEKSHMDQPEERRIMDLSHLVPEYPMDESVLNEYIFNNPDEARMWLADDDTPPKPDTAPEGEEKDNRKYVQTNLNTFQESTHKSTLERNHKQKGKMALSSLKRIDITEQWRRDNRAKYPWLKHIASSDKKVDVSAWMDGDNLVAAISVDRSPTKRDKVWIHNIHIETAYRGYGLSKQILDYATKKYGANALAVKIDNKIAQKVYLDYGFKFGTGDEDTMGNNKIMYLGEAAVVGPAVSTPEDLSRWMKRNIRYGNYQKLMTPAEVMDTGSGSCHDQVVFEYPILKRMKVHPKILFFIAINEERGTSGQTHSLIWWKNDRGKIYWFENSWGGNQGIHTFDSITEMKTEIRRLYAGNPDSKNNPQLVFQDTTIRNFKPGISLGDLVDAVYNEKKLDETVDDSETEYLEHPEVKDDTFNGEQIKFFQDQQTYKESTLDESGKPLQGLFHVSEEYLPTKTLTPRVPNNFMTKNGYEDNTTKRVCLSTSIHGCLRALSMNLEGKELHVYQPSRRVTYKRPTELEVPDVSLTNEVWVLSPVSMTYVGTIKVSTPKENNEGLPYHYGQNGEHTAELYDWEYEWTNQVNEAIDYKFSLEEEIVFNDDDLLDEAVSENSKLYPVYVVLIHSGTLVSNAIKKVSKAEFSHASISFDSTLKRMYSFARKDPKNPFAGGFRYESIGEGFYTQEKMDKTPFAIYLVPCTKYQIEKMKKRLKYFIENESKFTFDFIGLFKNYFGIVANPKMKWFCSRFVADILNAGANNKKKFIKEPSLMDPEDFKKTDFARFVCGGMLGSYNQKETDQITKGILKSEVLLRKQGKRFTYHTFGEAATYSDKIQWYKNAIRNETVEEYERSTKELRICFTPDMRMKLDKENYEVFYAVYRHLLTSFIDCGEYDTKTRMELYGKLQSLVKFFQQYFFPSVTDPATNEFASVYTRLHAEMLRGLSVCRKKLDTTVIPESVIYFQSGRTIPYLTETVYVVSY